MEPWKDSCSSSREASAHRLRVVSSFPPGDRRESSVFYTFTLLLFYSFTLLLFYSFTLLLFYSFTIEHMTLPLVAPRSADWAKRPLDINVLQINVIYVMNVRKLLKKRK